MLPQDGASQSFITVTARDANSQPMRNLTMRTETRVGGTPVDFGVLSARSVVTGNDGRATLVYTAPPSPAVSPDPFSWSTSSSRPRQRLQQLEPAQRGHSPRAAGTGQPAVQPGGRLLDHPAAIADRPVGALRRVARARERSRRTEWNFGDGARETGRTDDHDYSHAGTYIVTLTVVDSYGRSASKSQSLTVTAGLQPTAVFNFSPTVLRVGQTVNFNAAQSRPGRR